MALSQKNAEATKKLMEYERENKVTTFLNTYKLSSKFQLPIEEKKCSCSWLWKWLFKEDKVEESVDIGTNRPLNKGAFVDSDFPATAFSVCRDVEAVMEQNVEWIRIQELAQKSVPLFQNCSPYEIKQSNFVIKHCLTVFQSIIQYPWVIRTKIKKPPTEGMYSCLLYPKGQQT